MAVPTGTASFQDIEDEFGGSHPIALSEYYGAASGVPASGAISVDDFRGKSSIFEFDLTTGNGISLSTAATAAGWSGSVPIIANVPSSVTIGGSSTDYGLLIDTGSNNVTLSVTGKILGKGGNGGNANNGAGSAGGAAVKLDSGFSATAAITVNSGGLIGGGGGGGGGGVGSFYSDGMYAGGGGAGGAGRANSSGGAFSGSNYTSVAQGGTDTAGGPQNSYGGGAGGALGSGGGGGFIQFGFMYSYTGGSGGSPGAAGKAINLNGKSHTLVNNGTVSGAVS